MGPRAVTEPLPPALALRGLAKSFGGARALDGVELTVGAREIHGLLGHNGSGKSTLVKILSGYHAPDPGATLQLFGEPLRLPLTRAEQRARGLAFVHQNLGLAPQLSVLENMRVAEITAGRPFIDWRAQRRAALASLQQFGLSIDPDQAVASLPPVERALIAIVRAFAAIDATRSGRELHGLLVLDEPTPFLARDDVERLFRLMRQVVAQGASVLFISHDLDEILEITDRATVLRDGRVAGSFETRHTGRERIVELIAGHAPVATSSAGAVAGRGGAAAEIAFEVRELGGAALQPIDLQLRRGEIVGLTGLLGSGYEQVLQHLFGAVPATQGVLQAGRERIELRSLTPAAAVRAGFAFLPGDRQGASGAGGLSVLDNLLLPDLSRFFRGGRLQWPIMRGHAQALVTRHRVRPVDVDMKLAALSGGNAQKVLLAKWLDVGPRLLLLEEPTQGVDVGAREDLWAAIRDIAAAGTVVLCASSDLEQLEALCDRVLVFARGRCRAEVDRATLSKAELLRQCYAAVAA
ncbi:MAG: sugar ABC transporter ATP-binding protein [Sinobacteraceae bacterium]|nr:sugar ABC transporter ATP-binding protein [Nevskiaceae bacterium]